MSGYFLGLIIVSFVSAAVMSLTPQGVSKSYIRLLCGLCGVICVVLPVFSLFGDGEELAKSISDAFEVSGEIDENNVEIYNNSLNFAAVKNAEENLKSSIIAKKIAKYNDFDININIEEKSDGFYIDNIFVTLYPSGYSADPDEIEKICYSYFEVPVEFIYK